MKRHFFQRMLYNTIVVPAAYGGLSAAARFHPKLRETFRGRRNIRGRWVEASQRLSQRPVWFHVSSVGEYEQAKPVMNRLRQRFPDVPIALTFTSPSGYAYAMRKETGAANTPVQFLEYLPLDFASNARFCLDVLRPRLLVFVKFDLWPNLIWEATARDVPTVLIDATLSEKSHRHKELGRRFYQSVYEELRSILAISEDDARRFAGCVPDHPGIRVVGDTRFDRVMERKRMASDSIDVDTGDRFVILAGSTWPRDEVHLLDALARTVEGERQLLVILAPHEPTPERVRELETWAKEQRLDTSLLSEGREKAAANGNEAVIVDTVGVLAELYRFADIAYVGGSFSSGVHSVIEPAIMGIPVLFGPVHQNSFEAEQLLSQEAAFIVRDSGDIGLRLAELIRDGELRARMGERARAYVESQLGASDRCLEAIAAYIS